MTIYYLYVKTHKITGLKYLGQTTQNPYVYYGSGKDWQQHIHAFGKHIDTDILLQSNNKQEVNDLGRLYSKQWRILDAMDDFGNKIWANIIPETGGGPGVRVQTPAIKAKKSAKLKGRVFPHMKLSPSPATLLKMSAAQKGLVKGPMTQSGKDIRSAALLGILKGPQDTTTCPHCSKNGGVSNMSRYHFDNCKVKP